MVLFTNNSKQNYLSARIYPSTLTNVRFGVEDLSFTRERAIAQQS